MNRLLNSQALFHRCSRSWDVGVADSWGNDDPDDLGTASWTHEAVRSMSWGFPFGLEVSWSFRHEVDASR